MSEALLLVAALAAAWAMTGLIWTVQVVHYPLFDSVGLHGDDRSWASFSERHRRRMSLVVGPIMAVQLVTTILLVVDPPSGVSRAWPIVALVVVTVPYLTTAVVSVPLHQALAATYDERRHDRLVSTNWIRTGGWTVHAVVVATIACLAMGRT